MGLSGISRTAAALSLAGCLACHVKAAHISEVFLAPSAGVSHIWPDAVELDLLSQNEYDLLIMDASADRRYQVVQVVRLTTDYPLALLSEDGWSSNLWNDNAVPSSAQFRLSDSAIEVASPTGGLELRGSRTLLLFEGRTIFQAGRADYLAQLSEGRQEAATLVDWMTLGPSDLGWALNDEPAHPMIDGTVISLPIDPLTFGPVRANAVQAVPDHVGALPGSIPTYPFTPGLTNPVWQHAPEPSSVSLLFIGLLAIKRPRRNRRAT